MAKEKKEFRERSFHNKKAKKEYEILETLEAGIQLLGSEVKSIRAGRVNLDDSFVIPKDGEMFVVNLKIAPYENAKHFGHQETRTKKLLMHKKEIERWSSKVKEKRLTIIPLKLYFNSKNIVKLEIALCRGKKLYDKRQEERKKETEKQIQRVLKYKQYDY
ncbi:MAG: SsrA-binding protein SmpB [Leptospiraceae bacterium]|nr:SsrA-binding protein SmpB [Leptospiraceae bacterium]MDW7975492.1 SsrA-binding protein SmpB [Leptospiraceae bacterium]